MMTFDHTDHVFPDDYTVWDVNDFWCYWHSNPEMGKLEPTSVLILGIMTGKMSLMEDKLGTRRRQHSADTEAGSGQPPKGSLGSGPVAGRTGSE